MGTSQNLPEPPRTSAEVVGVDRREEASAQDRTGTGQGQDNNQTSGGHVRYVRLFRMAKVAKMQPAKPAIAARLPVDNYAPISQSTTTIQNAAAVVNANSATKLRAAASRQEVFMPAPR